MNTKFKQTIKSKHGSISLFAAAIFIPVLFFLFSLSLDVSKYYQTEQYIQHALDNAALAAGHQLPFVDSAKEVVWEILPPEFKSHTSATITSNSIDLRYANSVDGIFSRFFGIKASPQLFVHAKTESVPIQALLLLDSSNHEVASSSSVASSIRIDNDSIPNFEISRCFNSRYTGNKKAIIGMYEYLSCEFI